MNSRQKRRYKLAKKKLLGEGKYKGKQSKNIKFSDDDWGLLKKDLKNPIGELDTTNEQIVRHIWNIFKKENSGIQKKLLQLLGKMPHRWAMVLKTKQEIQGLQRKTEGFFFEKSTTTQHNLISKKSKDFLYSFPLETSKVQKQFLEKFLWGDKKGVLQEKILGSTVIIEQQKKIVWEDGKPEIQNKKYGFDMFWAVPFQFEKSLTVEEKIGQKKIPEVRNLGNTDLFVTNSTGGNQKQHRIEKNLLGIDLGEYGFGYAVFNPVTKKVLRDDIVDLKTGEIIEESTKIQGFIEVPYLKKMRDDAADWKDTQKSGTFSHPTTGLAKIREQAAGSVRNQIHALALKYNAIPVYEDSVDGFETGGQRISKLYKTIKTADCASGSQNAADDGVRAHFWGNKYVYAGSVIGASMTSQTCRKCGICATYQVDQIFGENGEVEVKNGKISTPKGEVLIHTEDKIYSEKSDKKFLKERIKSAQRKESDEEKLSRESGKAKRGTIERFHCQMENCQNSTDCDAQAAHNIALKYFLKLLAENNGDDKKDEYLNDNGQFQSLKYFMEKGEKY